MIALTLLTTDARLTAIVQAYWAWSAEDGWSQKTVDIERQWGLSRGTVQSLVKQASTARLTIVGCAGCGAHPPVHSRAQAEEVRRRLASSRTPVERRLCQDCVEAMAQARREAEKNLELQRCRAVQKWVADDQSRAPSRRYTDISLRHAFMLLGLLRHETGDWRSGRLRAWSDAQPRLWSTGDQVAQVYLELFQAGWIRPCAQSPTKAFGWEQNTPVTLRPLEAHWQLIKDAAGLDFEYLETTALTVVERATAPQLYDVWEWVCLNEVRDTYHYYCKDYHFDGPGWIPSLEANVRRLLQTCSVSQARTLMRSQIKSLTAELQRRVRQKSHVFNMLPGGLLRGLDFLRAAGHPIYRAQRLTPKTESLYTSLLFDTVLGSSEFYYEMTGAQLRQL